MWSYYGAKTNVIDFYPNPKHDRIIEPFAGSAQYALKYFDHNVLLVDKYEVIIKIWLWLQKCSPKDILNLPRLKHGDHISKFKFDCEEAELLISFFMGFSSPAPRKTATVKHKTRPNYLNYNLQKIANNLFKIKHWEIRCDSYENILNEEATWFVDPPYQFGGSAYKHSNKKIDFNHLAQWCKSRIGQVIVCESRQANWLDFKPLTVQTTSRGRQYEVIWTNYPTIHDNKQLEFFKTA